MILALSDQIRKVKDLPVVPMVLVGNKCDLTDKIVVSSDEAKTLAESKLNGSYFEASAKTRLNIDEIFVDIARQIIQVFPPRRASSCLLL